MPLENDPLAVSIHWQPPLRPNGQIDGKSRGGFICVDYMADAVSVDWVVVLLFGCVCLEVVLCR